MASKNQVVSSSGGGISLTMLFIVLKLVGVISWSWWWVLAPTWIPLVLVLILVSFVAAFATLRGSVW